MIAIRQERQGQVACHPCPAAQRRKPGEASQGPPGSTSTHAPVLPPKQVPAPVLSSELPWQLSRRRGYLGLVREPFTYLD